MVQAILNGRKSQTRRIVKPQPRSTATEIVLSHQWSGRDHAARFKYNGEDKYEVTDLYKCPYGKIGDVLWVREKWAYRDCQSYYYFASNSDEHIEKWKPSIHMPKEACRIKLEITNIRVERVQYISKADAIAEGIEVLDGMSNYKNYLHGKGANYGYVKEAKISYMTLWESINGKDSWNTNPWVWVLSFKKVNALETSESPLKE